MAKILTFRNAGGETPPSQDFLQEGGNTLSFEAAEDGSPVLNELPVLDFKPLSKIDRSQDWQNQELADLYRVKRLLDAAGVRNDIDRGLTDEGDPWFVFCGADGEVFIHLCRIEGLYLLDSPNLTTPLKGYNFNELIADFTNNSLPAKAALTENGDARVVRLERGGKVFLHPSALLAALIWTLFLAAEELVVLAPDAPTADLDLEDDALFGDFEVASDGSFALSEDAFVDHLVGAKGDGSEAAAHTDDDAQYTAEGDLYLRELNTQQGMALAQNSYALGLSSIAIAFGFLSEVALMDDRNAVLEAMSLVSNLTRTEGTDTDSDLQGDADHTATVAALLEDIGAFFDTLMAKKAPLPGEPGTDSVAQDGLQTAGIVMDTQGLVAALAGEATVLEDTEALAQQDNGQDSLRADVDVVDVVLEGEDLAQAAQGEEGPTGLETVTLTPAQFASTVNLSSLVQSLLPDLQGFTLGTLEVQASFDLSRTPDLTLGEDMSGSDTSLTALIAQDDVGVRSNGVRDFDETATAFLNFFLSRPAETEIITFGNEVLLIDTAALPSLGTDTYLVRWELDNGEIVSMIGLQSDYNDISMFA